MASNGDPICKHGIYWAHCGRCWHEQEGAGCQEVSIVIRDADGRIYKDVKEQLNSGNPVFVSGPEKKESVEDIFCGIFKALMKVEQDDPEGFKKAFSKENMQRYSDFIKSRS